MVKNHDPMANRTRGLIPLPQGDVPSTTQCITICIPNGEAYKRQLYGLLYEATHWNAYERDESHKATSVAKAWRNAILEGMLNCYQFKIIDGIPAFSNDGGETWTPVPSDNSGQSGKDAKHDEPLKPHRAEQDARCLAAANATAVFVELHREVVAWYNAGYAVLNLCNSISNVLEYFFPTLWRSVRFTFPLLAIADDILAHTSALSNDSFTAEIQDDLTCILNCRADEYGQWSEAAFTDVSADIDSMTGEMWELLKVYIDEIGGYAGLNNAGVTTSVTSHSCADCVCGECPPYITEQLTKVAYPTWISPEDTGYGYTFTLTGSHSGGCYPDNSCTMNVGDQLRVDFNPPVCVCGIGQLFARTNNCGAVLTIHDTQGNNHQLTSSLPGTPNDTNWGPFTDICTTNFASIESDYMILTGTTNSLIVDGLRIYYALKE